VRQFSFGVDWWQVKLDDIIAVPSAQEVVTGFRNGDATYANSVRLDAEGNIETLDTFTVNSGKAKVEGYDINANYRDSFPWGEVGLSFQGTYVDKVRPDEPGWRHVPQGGDDRRRERRSVIGATTPVASCCAGSTCCRPATGIATGRSR
jgi:outer membrane receptor protein involved in Fe transport